MALIEVINDANTVLIDDEYSNACLALKGSLTLSAGVDATDCYQVQLSYTSADNPMLALELNDIQVAATYTTRSGNTWTWYIFFRKAYVNRTLTYYIFTVPSAVADANGLVQLFDATGKLVFDSSLKYLRVKNFYDGPATGNMGTDLVTGRTYAAIAVRPFWSSLHMLNPPAQGSPPYTFLDVNGVGLFYRSGNNLVTAGATTFNANSSSATNTTWSYNSGNPAVLLVDVTGF
jgi:hypothetical protein